MNNKTLKSFATLFTICAFAFTLALNFNANMKKNEQGKEIDLKINTAHANSDYNMAWHDNTNCWACEPISGSCNVSDQCCFTQEPYCIHQD